MGLNILARIAGDNSHLKRTLNETRNLAAETGRAFVHELGSKMQAVFGMAALEQGIHRTIEWGSHIHDTAKQIGITSEELQQLEYAAQLSGAEMSDLIKAFRGMSKARMEALAGGEKGEKTKSIFKLFGIDENELRSGKPFQIFTEALTNAKNMDLGGSEMALFDKIFGKTGDKLIPAAKEGLGELISEFKRLGLVVDDHVIKALDNLDDRLKKLQIGMRSFLAKSLSGFETTGEAIAEAWSRSRLDPNDPKFRKFGLESIKQAGADIIAQKHEESKADKKAKDESDKRAAEREAENASIDQRNKEREDQAKAHQARMDRVNKTEGEAAKLEAQKNEKTLTPQQRKAELLQKQASLQKEIAALATQSDDILNQPEVMEYMAGLRKDKAQTDLDLLGIKSDKLKSDSDSLTSVGNFLGERGDTSQARTIDELQQMKQQLVEINNKIKEGSALSTGEPPI